MDFNEIGDGDIDLNSLSDEELKELIRVNKETQTSLQEEITTLKRQINLFGIDLVPPKELQLVTRRDGSSNIESVEAHLAAEIKKNLTRIEETVQLTDVVIQKVESEVTEMDSEICKRQFSVDLEMYDRKMQLKCVIDEKLTELEEDSPNTSIVWFEVSFDHEINSAIGSEIVKAADKTAIHSVFSLLKTFLQWHRIRANLMEHFLRKYPDNVQADTQSDVHVLKLFQNTQDRPLFMIEWDRKIVDSRVVPDLRLKVTAPEEMLLMDEKKLLQKAPEMFANMLSSYGQEKAIDNLINLVIRNKQTPQESNKS